MSTRRSTPGFKAVLAILVVTGGLIWHILACVESEMAYSPDGKTLAFTTMDPMTKQPWQMPRTGEQTFRLFLITSDKGNKLSNLKLDLVEESRTHILTGPAISHDNKQLAYVRVKMPATQPEMPDEPKPATAPDGEPMPQDVQAKNCIQPDVDFLADLRRLVDAAPRLSAELVIRDLVTRKETSATPLPLIHLPMDEKGKMDYLGRLYGLGRLAFSPDDKKLYFSDSVFAYGIDPATQRVDMLLASKSAATLSPDGLWLASSQDDVIAFVRTDGSRTVYQRLPEGKTAGMSLVWMDKTSVAAVGKSEILRVPVDGSATKTLFTMTGHKDGKPAPLQLEGDFELAVNSSADRWALQTIDHFYLMDKKGKVLLDRDNGKDVMFDGGVWRPDGKVLAVKRMFSSDKNPPRVTDILFLDDDGKELAKVAIPVPATPKD